MKNNRLEVSSVLQGDHAVLSIETGWTANTSNHMIEVRLFDDENRIVSSVCSASPKLSLTLERPNLWNGIADPYLYIVEARLVEGGNVIAAKEATIGIKDLSFHPDLGMFLNGQPTALKGLKLPADGKTADKEANFEDLAQVVDQLHASGVQAVLVNFNQHSQDFFDLCEETGLIVWPDTKESLEQWSKHVLEISMS